MEGIDNTQTVTSKGTLSYEKDHGQISSGGSLYDRTPPEKHAKLSLFKDQNAELKALNNAHGEG